MTLKELEAVLEGLRAQGAMDDSPIVAEGELAESVENADEGDFVQARVVSARVESRCEDEAPGVYLEIVDVSVG